MDAPVLLPRSAKRALIPSIWMVHRWCMAGKKTTRAARLPPPVAAPRMAETEKLTLNLGVVDLGRIDLLVQEGFYSNRTDLIRTAIRNQLTIHADAVNRTVERRTLVLGLQHFSRTDLEAAKAAHQVLQIQVLGLARIADDVSPELARATIQSVAVLGVFHASAAVRKALADRIT